MHCRLLEEGKNDCNGKEVDMTEERVVRHKRNDIKKDFSPSELYRNLIETSISDDVNRSNYKTNINKWLITEGNFWKDHNKITKNVRN